MKIEIEKTVLLKLSPKDFDMLSQILQAAEFRIPLEEEEHKFINKFLKETGEVI